MNRLFEKMIIYCLVGGVFLALVVYIGIPLLILGGIGFIGYCFYIHKRNQENSPEALEAKELEAAKEEEALVLAHVGTFTPPKPFEFVDRVTPLCVPSLHRKDRAPPKQFFSVHMELVEAVAHEAIKDFQPPRAPVTSDPIAVARYRDDLERKAAILNDDTVELVVRATANSLSVFYDALPDALFFATPVRDIQTLFTVPLLTMLPHPARTMGAVVAALVSEEVERKGLLYGLRQQIEANLAAIQAEINSKHYIPLEDLNWPPEKVARAAFGNTPFLKLFLQPAPFGVRESWRFEHHWIVSPPGTGKTTLLQAMLSRDFEWAANGECSVVIMDSQGDLINAIKRLYRFSEGAVRAGQPAMVYDDGVARWDEPREVAGITIADNGKHVAAFTDDLHTGFFLNSERIRSLDPSRLILIDPTDVEFPVALNLFDIGLGDMENATPLEKEMLLNSAVYLLDYVFRALLGAELTSRQSTLFNFTIQLLLNIPGATLDTMIDLMQPKGLTRYEEHLAKLDDDARSFFDLKFNAKEFEQTKAQVVDRLFAIKRIRALSRMFSSPKTKLNLYEEMGKGRVILINAAQSLLQNDGVEVFSRFFLANILMAAQKRQLLPPEQRKPTFVYIDECQDVIRRDEMIPGILDQARKYKVGMVLAHQRLDQLTPPVLNALMGSTAIKFAAALTDANASVLARNMGTTPEFILKQPKYHYAAHIRGHTTEAVSLVVPHADFRNEPQMSDDDFEKLRANMRERYAISKEPKQLPGPEPEPPPSPDGDPQAPDPAPNAPTPGAAAAVEVEPDQAKAKEKEKEMAFASDW